MKLTQFQKEFVKKYNKDISDGSKKLVNPPCLCGGTEFKSVYKYDRYGLWCPSVICNSCGLIQLNPRLSDDEYGNFYESDSYRLLYGDKNFLETYREKFLDPINRHIFDILVPIIKERKYSKILEFGSGGGWKLLPFHEEGYDVTGYDFSSKLVDLGKTYGLNLIKGSTKEIEGGPYDVIIVNHVAEHFTDFFSEMNNILRHLNKDGIIFVGVPNIDNFGKSQFQNAHILYFTPRTFKHYMSKLKLEPIEFGNVYGGHMYGIFSLSEKSRSTTLDDEFFYMRKKILRGKLISIISGLLSLVGIKEYVRKLFVKN